MSPLQPLSDVIGTLHGGQNLSPTVSESHGESPTDEDDPNEKNSLHDANHGGNETTGKRIPYPTDIDNRKIAQETPVAYPGGAVEDTDSGGRNGVVDVRRR